jgi:DMSO reductase anchor subunit
MKPPVSLLLLTVLGGTAMGTVVTLAILASDLTPPVLAFTLGTAWVLGTLGALASFFHMHRLKAARYVLSRLKTSWLSREVLTTGLFVAATLAAWVSVESPFASAAASRLLLLLAAALGVVAAFVTAMIYRTIPAMRSWYTPWTVPAMMGTGLVVGAAVDAALFALLGAPSELRTALDAAVGAAGLLLGAVKIAQWQAFSAAWRWLTQQHAGLGPVPYRVHDTGTSRPPYRTQTQVWPSLPPATRIRLKAVVLLALVGGPLLIALSTPLPALTSAAAGLVLAGALVERWLFFADAVHSSRLWFSDPSPFEATRTAGFPVPGRQP